jgi:hypothetical protein
LGRHVRSPNFGEFLSGLTTREEQLIVRAVLTELQRPGYNKFLLSKYISDFGQLYRSSQILERRFPPTLLSCSIFS